MAGTGPAPKPSSQRRNRAAPQRGEWIDLEPLDKPVLPELDGEGFSGRTLQVWEAWRSDPVTTQWSPADVDYARDTIELREYAWPAKAPEIRLRMDALGLTPKGKRDNRWRISPPAEVLELPKGSAADRMAELRERAAAAERPA